MSTPNILPDSRPRHTKGAKYDAEFGWLIPIACINCGKRAGYVTEENVRHVAALCDSCGEKYGAEGATYVPPDRVYHDAIREESIQKFGRLLTPSELAAAATEAHHPLASLARDLHKPVPRG